MIGIDKGAPGMQGAGNMVSNSLGVPPGTNVQTSPIGQSAHTDPAALQRPRPVRPLSRFPQPRANEILVGTMGGLGQIGMNWTLYGHNGGWLAADAGIGFPKERDGTVDAITLDPLTLRSILSNLHGLIVTHAHEDHIGSIDRLWPGVINCPIYATPFAIRLLQRRFEEAGVRTEGSGREVDIVPFQVGDSFGVGPFQIRALAVTHSVPEPVALAISTPAGTVVHTGDFKLDDTPLLGSPPDRAGLAEVGAAGVLAVIGDSTNAERDLPTTSEASVLEAYRQLFKSRQGAVVVCCFASNVARMASAMTAAGESGRMVALAGRSMRTNHEIAEELGMMKGVPMPLAEASHLVGLDHREVALVCTGTQGEERAALGRLARGDNRLPQLGRGDTVVMSARAIPGNGDAIDKVVAALRRRGVEVLDGSTLVEGYPVHVSGHAGQGELSQMYSMLKPRFAIPVHGTPQGLAAHGALALACGVEAVHVGAEGHVLSVSASGLRLLGQVRADHLELENDERGNRVPLSMPAIHALRRPCAAPAAPALAETPSPAMSR